MSDPIILELHRLELTNKLLRKYVRFLGEEYEKAWSFCRVHGLVVPEKTVKKGDRLRAAIDRSEE